MGDYSEAPEEVQAIRQALLANAKRAERDAFWVYCSEERSYPGYRPTGSWVLGSNMGGDSMVHTPDGEWFYRTSYDGVDHAMVGGFEEAKANASCWFTG